MRWTIGNRARRTGHRLDPEHTVALWRLDNTVETTDETGNYNLTAIGSVSGTGNMLWSADNGGSSSYLDASGYLTGVNDAALVGVLQANYTVAGWVSCTHSASRILDVASGGLGGLGYNNWLFKLAFTASGQIEVEWQHGSSAAATTITTTGTVPSGEHVYIAVTVRPASNGTTTDCDVDIRWWYSGIDPQSETFINQTRNTDSVAASCPIYLGNPTSGRWLDDWTILDVPTDEAAFLARVADFAADYDEEDLYGKPHDVHARVLVEDSDGTFRDLSDVGGGRYDMLAGLEIADGVDALSSTCRVSLFREIYDWSLSPERTDSFLNLDAAGLYEPLLDVARKVRVEVAITPDGHEPAEEWEWLRHWEGLIDRVDFGADVVTLACRDYNAAFDAWIEEKRIYGGSGDPTTVRRQSLSVFCEGLDGHNFAVGDTFVVEGTTNYDGTYTVHAFGGNYIRNNFISTDYGDQSGVVCSPVEQEIQKIIDDAEPAGGYLVDTPTLEVIGSPDWLVNGFAPDRQAVSRILDDLAMQQGWNCRWRWSNAHHRQTLQYYEVERAPVSAWTFAAASILGIQQASVDIAPIRNAVEVSFEDRDATANPDGSFPLVTSTDDDATSIARYGRRWGRVLNAANIDRSDEADSLAAAIVADLSEPEISTVITVPFRRFVELGDLYTFEGNRLWDQDKELAVVGYQHRIGGDGQPTTTLQLRGTVAARFRGYFRRLLPASEADRPSGATVVVPRNLTATADPHSVLLTWDRLNAGQNKNLACTEIHFSTSSGFTASSSTLWRTVPHPDVDDRVKGLDPNTTYYFQAINVDKQGNRSSATAEVSATTRFITGRPSFVAENTTGLSSESYGGIPDTVPLTSEIIDEGGDFAANVFTCPRDGVYSFHLGMDLSSFDAGSTIEIVISHRDSGGTTIAAVTQRFAPGISTPSISVPATFKMEATDTVRAFYNAPSGSGTYDIDYITFSGAMAGGDQ